MNQRTGLFLRRTMGALVACVALAHMGIAGAAPIDVVDGVGHHIVLRGPAGRVVSLSPHATELLFDVGAGRQVVGTSEASDYPEPARHIEHVAGYRGADIERIARLRPALVVAWTSGNADRDLEALERIGIPVYRSDPPTPEAIATDLENLGVLTGHAAEGQAQASAFLARWDELRRRGARNRPVTVFFQVSEEPLMTVGASHLISQVMSACGGRNVFGDINALAARVDREAAISRNPQYIVATARADEPSPLAWWQKWADVAAVRNHHLYVLDPDSITRPTPRILDGAAALCDAFSHGSPIDPGGTPNPG